jgi:hypothetical protein
MAWMRWLRGNRNNAASKSVVWAADLRQLTPVPYERVEHYPDGLQWTKLAKHQHAAPSLLNGKCAAISWRWDLDASRSKSTNLAHTLNAAARDGFDWAVFDLVTVDQGSRPDEVIRDVAALSAYFSRLPIYATYDTKNEAHTLYSTIWRPWIFYECQALAENKRRITYISHQKDFAGPDAQSFDKHLEEVWTADARQMLLLLLSERVGIGNFLDLQFILDGNADLVKSIAKQMNENDAVLFLYLALSLNDYSDQIRGNRKLLSPISEVSYSRFRFAEIVGPDSAYKYYDIFFDQK